MHARCTRRARANSSLSLPYFFTFFRAILHGGPSIYHWGKDIRREILIIIDPVQHSMSNVRFVDELAKWNGIPFVFSFHMFLIYVPPHLNFIEVKTETKQAFHRSHRDWSSARRKRKNLRLFFHGINPFVSFVFLFVQLANNFLGSTHSLSRPETND